MLGVELKDISIKITGPKEPYFFTYYIGPNLGFEESKHAESFLVHMNFLSSLAGGGQDVSRVV